MSHQSLSRSVAFLALATASAAHAGDRVLYVDRSRPAGGDGTTWESAFDNLQAAFDRLPQLGHEVTQQDIVIKIAGGVYRAEQTRPSAFQMAEFTSSGVALFIQGAYGGFNSPTPDARDFVATPTVLSGDVLGDDGPNFSNRADNCKTVLATMDYNLPLFDPPAIYIDGLVIQGGHSLTKRPSGVYVATYGFTGEPPYLRTTFCWFFNCIIRDNFGTAIATHEFSPSGMSLALSDCTLSGNRTEFDGAAIRTAESQEIRAIRCRFLNNHAANGGAVAADDYASFGSCLFAGNTASGNGGAVSQTSDRWYGSTFSSCLFTNNVAGAFGGAVATELMHVVRCTIVHNTASWGGGAFLASRSSLDSSVVSMNVATVSGDQVAGGGPLPTMRAVAIDGLEQGLFFPFASTQPRIGYELFPHVAQFVSQEGADGLASTWQDNDYHLDPRSPLIDAVFTDFPTRDLDWNSGPVEGVAGRGLRLDLGCYESQVTLCPSDIDADGGVSIDDLLGFLVAFENGQPLADLTTNGTTPFPDGGVTIDDLLCFLARFEQGC